MQSAPSHLPRRSTDLTWQIRPWLLLRPMTRNSHQPHFGMQTSKWQANSSRKAWYPAAAMQLFLPSLPDQEIVPCPASSCSCSDSRAFEDSSGPHSIGTETVSQTPAPNPQASSNLVLGPRPCSAPSSCGERKYPAMHHSSAELRPLLGIWRRTWTAALYFFDCRRA